MTRRLGASFASTGRNNGVTVPGLSLKSVARNLLRNLTEGSASGGCHRLAGNRLAEIHD